MPRNYFITGMPKAGKTALLRRLIKALKAKGLRVGGLISPEERHHGTRTGFYVKDVASGKIARLADVDADGPKISKYHVDIKSFESVAVPAMRGFRNYDVIFIDEVGPMELKSGKFSDLLDRVMESDTPIIASLHSNLAPKYGFYGEMMLLAENNREAVYNELVRKLRELGKKPAVKKAAAKPAKAQRRAAKKAGPKKAGGKRKAGAAARRKKAAKAVGPKPVPKEPGPMPAAEEEPKPQRTQEKPRKKKKGILDNLLGLFR